MTDQPRYYITTPIYYVNDRPHIGHVYTTTVCDIAARFHRFAGYDVFFLTGTDEHGLKVEKSAQEQGITPQELADINSAEFESVMKLINMSNDDFIRTTQPRHINQVKTLVKQLIDSGAVYLGEYEGWYDEGQEEYVTETKAEENDFKSPISGKPLVRAKESNYFFKLSAYEQQLRDYIEAHPDFVRPVARKNEVLGRLKEGLQDIPISRTNFNWGIPVPGDEQHVIYVWVDALFNYITAIGLADPDCAEAARRKYWPANYHIIGKEILFFHAVVWPAMLMALNIPLPGCVYAHSFWIREGRKMSKSLGNFIDLETIQTYTDKFGLDAWRWYTATQGPLGATDADFAHSKFIEVYNNELANTLGNAVNRVTNMTAKYFDSKIPDPAGNYTIEGYDWLNLTNEIADTVIKQMQNMELALACDTALGLVRQVNAYIDATRPFTMAKDPNQQNDLACVLYNCIEAIRIASVLLWAAIPEKMQTFWKMLDLNYDTENEPLTEIVKWGGLKAGAPVIKCDPLFPRYTE